MILPTLSINGTAKSELFENAAEAKFKLLEAIEALRKTVPNGLDYQYAEPGAFEGAQKEFVERMAKMHSIIADVDTFLEHTA